jgi:hypothetical protein
LRPARNASRSDAGGSFAAIQFVSSLCVFA